MTRRIKCPTCHRETEWTNNPYRPFCSDRCKLIDLGAWTTERYRIPGEETEASNEEQDDEDEDSDKDGR
jgi:endogenous inhibitor of DNA gyrase (YacG/DUF329 family)